MENYFVRTVHQSFQGMIKMTNISIGFLIITGMFCLNLLFGQSNQGTLILIMYAIALTLYTINNL